MSEPLDLLLIESEPGAGDSAARSLSRAGHNVHRCHPPGDQGWACVGMADPSACPLERHIDAAVVVRSPDAPLPTGLEDGVRCAIRSRVPLVGVGLGDDDSYEPWLTLRADESVLDAACHAAVELGHRVLEGEVLDRVANLVRGAELDIADVRCTIVNRDRALRVSIVLPYGSDLRLEQAVGVRAYDALRPHAGTYHRIDVAVGSSPDGHDLLAGLAIAR